MSTAPRLYSTIWGKSDRGGTVVAILGLTLSAACWLDTKTMMDADSFIFPRAIILFMGGLCLLLLLRNMFFLGIRQPPPLEGSPRRMVLLVAIMLITGLLVTVLGFLPATLLAFLSLMAVSQWDKWTLRTLAIYSLVGLVIVTGFYLSFKYLLGVPLPAMPLP